MRLLNKVLSMALATTMITCSLASCTNNSDQTNNNQTDTSTTGSSTANSNEGEGDDNSQSASGDKELITIRISADAKFEFDPEKDDLAKFIKDKFNIVFEDVPYEGDVEKMMLDATSGTLADVCYTEPMYDLYSFATFINSGFFREIPDEILADYPITKNMVDSSEVCAAIKDYYGNNYILPKPDSRDPSIYIAERKGIFYRKDWLEKVGITKEPETYEELYNMAKAFTLNDPDGNGKNDTIGLTSDGYGNFRYFMANVGHTNLNWIKGDDGKWVYGAFTEDNIEPLEWFRKMYQEGYLDPEFASLKADQATQKFAAESVGAVSRNADADWINNVVVKDFYAATADKYENPFDVVGMIPILKKDADSEFGLDKYMDTMCATQISADMDDEKLKRYLEFHEYFTTDEGELYRLGIEGKDWEYDADKNIKKILHEDGLPTNLDKTYPSLPVIRMSSWGFHQTANPKFPTFDNFDAEIKALNKQACDKRNPYAVSFDIRPKLISEDAVIDAAVFKVSAEYGNIVMGTEPVEKMFKDMVQRAMDSGYKAATETVNRIAEEKGWN